MTDQNIQICRQAAVQFLQLAMAGHIAEAYEKYVNLQGKHHNPYFSAGFPALREGMIKNHAQFPDKQIIIKNVVGDNRFVVIHSHLIPTPGDKGVAVVHLFRFADDRIVEMWDLGQAVPVDSPNQDGMF